MLPGPRGIAGAQLAQQGDQGIADECIDFVQHEHQGSVQHLAPTREKGAQCASVGSVVQHSTRQLGRRGIAGDETRPARNIRHHDGHGLRHILAQRLGRLDVGVDGQIISPPVEVIGQRQQARSLAGLPRGVEQEVFLLRDERQHVVEIEARQRRQAVVVGAVDRAFGGEEAHGVLLRGSIARGGVVRGWEAGAGSAYSLVTTLPPIGQSVQACI